MAFTKINAAGIGSTETVTLDGLTVINDGSFGGNVSVGGTLTYEDVTNIDSVGLITARAGVVVGSGITLSQDGDIFATGITTVSGNVKVGTGITLSPDGDVFSTGVTTATTFVGALTGNVTGNVTGNISGGTVAGSTGTFSGAVSGTTGTFSSNISLASGKKLSMASDVFKIYHATNANIINESGDFIINNTVSNKDIIFSTGSSPTEALRIVSDGDVGIGTATVFADSKVHICDSSASNYRSLVIDSSATNGSTMIYKQNGSQVIAMGSGGGNVLSGSNLTHGLIRSEVATVFAVGNSEKVRIATDGVTLKNMGAGGGLAINALGTTSEYGLLTANANRPNENDLLLGVGASWNGDSVAQIDFRAGADTSNKNDGRMFFFTQENTSDGLVERLRIDEKGRLGINGAATKSMLEVRASGGATDKLTAVFGANEGTTAGTLTDNTDKACRIGVQHYDTDAKPFTFLVGSATSGANTLNLGGGTSLMNGATEIRFSTESGTTNNGGEARIMINADGDTLFGSAVTNGSGGVGLTIQRASGLPYIISNTSNTSRVHNYFQYNGTSVGTITTSTGQAFYNNLSDYRSKENDVKITDGIEKIKLLRPIRFNYKVDKDTICDGFFAHEVTPAAPSAVTGEKDAVDSEGNISSQMLDTGKIIPLLTAALQEAITKIETLEAKVDTLEG